MKTWIAFFSQTGGEILRVSKKLGRLPDLLITNNQDLEYIDHDLLKCLPFKRFVILPDRPTLEEYRTALELTEDTTHNIIVTLHGYLRIIPPELCQEYDIVNGHPGLITKYPELKGKDPQKRAINYPSIGSVLHRVTAGVDEGPIIAEREVDNFDKLDEEAITLILKDLSEKLWVDLLGRQYKLGIIL